MFDSILTCHTGLKCLRKLLYLFHIWYIKSIWGRGRETCHPEARCWCHLHRILHFISFIIRAPSSLDLATRAASTLISLTSPTVCNSQVASHLHVIHGFRFFFLWFKCKTSWLGAFLFPHLSDLSILRKHYDEYLRQPRVRSSPLKFTHPPSILSMVVWGTEGK